MNIYRDMINESMHNIFTHFYVQVEIYTYFKNDNKWESMNQLTQYSSKFMVHERN